MSGGEVGGGAGDGAGRTACVTVGVAATLSIGRPNIASMPVAVERRGSSAWVHRDLRGGLRDSEAQVCHSHERGASQDAKGAVSCGYEATEPNYVLEKGALLQGAARAASSSMVVRSSTTASAALKSSMNTW